MTGASLRDRATRQSRSQSTLSPPKASVPSAARRRTFKPFDQAPRDGTPFHIPTIVRFNPFAKTFEVLYRDLYSGELSWEPRPGLWRSTRFCDLLPLLYEPPTSFAMTFVATPVRPTMRQRLTRYLSRLLCRVRP